LRILERRLTEQPAPQVKQQVSPDVERMLKDEVDGLR
jgi:predicted RNase H-like nuclease (RuvC/YqgF family)